MPLKGHSPFIEERQIDIPVVKSSARLNGHGVFAVVIFVVVTLIVNRPVYLPIPFTLSKSLDHFRRYIASGLDDTAHAGSASSNAVTPVAPNTRTAATTSVHHSNSKSPPRRRYIPLTHVSAPIIAILFLLATKTIGGQQLKAGIVGDEGVKPYSVLALFISLAYIAISLDATGLLRYLAFHVSLRGGRSGPQLFYLLYAFFFTLGLLVGNDPVILSGTAFLVHFTRIAGLSRPDAWIWAQFTAANISSALLVSSNPTNIVIAAGFGVNFITYSAFMALPTAVSGAAALVVIRFMFRTQPAGHARMMGLRRNGSYDKGAEGDNNEDTSPAEQAEALPPSPTDFPRNDKQEQTPPEAPFSEPVRPRSVYHRGAAPTVDRDVGESPSGRGSPSASIRSRPTDMHSSPHLLRQRQHTSSPPRDVVYIPQHLIAPDVRPREALVDPFGAIFGSIVMAATLAVLVGTSVTGTVEVYEIALPGAAICLLRDVFKDLNDGRKERQRRIREGEAGRSNEAGVTANGSSDQEDGAIEMRAVEASTGFRSPQNSTPALKASTDSPPDKPPPVRRQPARTRMVLWKILHFPRWWSERLPTVTAVFERLPLPLLPFAFGMFILVESLDHVGFIAIMARGLGRVCAGGGDIGTALFIGYLSVLLCSLGGTNIGACILLVRAIVSTPFTSQLPLGESRESITRTAIYSLALGSNVGALGGTFASSLAGLLWRQSLRQGGIQVRPQQMALWSLWTTPLALLPGLLVVWAQSKSGRWPE